jgi:hypothetical protein
VELEHRNLNSAGHGYGDRYLRWHEYQQPHPDWLNSDLMLTFRNLAKCIVWNHHEPAYTDQVLNFIAYFNRTMAKPFKWTYQGKPLHV